MVKRSSYFALIPAAGAGARVGSHLPKQYLPLLGLPLVWHAVYAMCNVAQMEKVFVVVAPDDDHWDRHDWSSLGSKLTVLRCGGKTRAASVGNGLLAIANIVAAEDWILVHDAARACISPQLIERLIADVGQDPVGGILAQPVADTLKRADDERRIEASVSRERLWQAQTPQMFRHALLLRALQQNHEVTDEAGAIEALGLRPKLVAGDGSNLKVTWAQDLHLAECILKERSAA